jgi:hypothetical protein
MYEAEDPLLDQFGLPNEYIAPQQSVLRSRTPSPDLLALEREVDELDDSDLAKLLGEFTEDDLVEKLAIHNAAPRPIYNAPPHLAESRQQSIYNAPPRVAESRQRSRQPQQRRFAGSMSKGGKLYKRARKSRRARRTRRTRRARN